MEGLEYNARDRRGKKGALSASSIDCPENCEKEVDDKVRIKPSIEEDYAGSRVDFKLRAGYEAEIDQEPIIG